MSHRIADIATSKTWILSKTQSCAIIVLPLQHKQPGCCCAVCACKERCVCTCRDNSLFAYGGIRYGQVQLKTLKDSVHNMVGGLGK
jgi:hypothetical protein